MSNVEIVLELKRFLKFFDNRTEEIVKNLPKATYEIYAFRREVKAIINPLITQVDKKRTDYSWELEEVSSIYSCVNLGKAQEKFEKEYILKIFRRNRWNLLDTAKNLGISRTSLWRKIKKHGITKAYIS